MCLLTTSFALRSIFARARHRDKKTKRFLWLHFLSFAWISEIVWMAWACGNGETSVGVLCFVRGLALTVLFYFG